MASDRTTTTDGDAWQVLRALALQAKGGQPAPDGWRPDAIAADDVALFEMYLPLCVGPRAPDLIVAHLAQSLDGRIATPAGLSQFISGREDVEHAHRMRALFDAVVVGAGTVALDDPQLTCRLVAGDHAARVVIDPDRRLSVDHAVFRDGAAPTLLCCRARAGLPARHGDAELVAVAGDPGAPLPVVAICQALAERGLRRLFVEGGGVTVSRFLAAGMLDRLQVAVAPCILGSGRPAFSLPPIEQLSEAIQLDCRHVAFGPDVLFDCVLPPRVPRGTPPRGGARHDHASPRAKE